MRFKLLVVAMLALLIPGRVASAQAIRGCTEPSGQSLSLIKHVLSDPSYAPILQKFGIVGADVSRMHRKDGVKSGASCARVTRLVSGMPRLTPGADVQQFELDGADLVTVIEREPGGRQNVTHARVAFMRDEKVIGVITVK